MGDLFWLDYETLNWSCLSLGGFLFIRMRWRLSQRDRLRKEGRKDGLFPVPPPQPRVALSATNFPPFCKHLHIPQVSTLGPPGSIDHTQQQPEIRNISVSLCESPRETKGKKSAYLNIYWLILFILLQPTSNTRIRLNVVLVLSP